ncbi:MAG: 2-oxoglutarate dehydrogenase, E2 component, dihydrolipoamide succinyltransferase, partial [Solirubrobacterales bacterium]|nr:2-oxoglutarate dehydrogenase, E2 component, dihydrolipoamide succinyltransferase [Solirubrobacterales bacterium]
MPQMGVSVAEGTVVAWHKQPGDWVETDESIGEVSTDKIDTEIPSPASGRLIEVLVQIGVTVDVGVTLARIATDADRDASFTPPPATPAAPAPSAATPPA